MGKMEKEMEGISLCSYPIPFCFNTRSRWLWEVGPTWKSLPSITYSVMAKGPVHLLTKPKNKKKKRSHVEMKTLQGNNFLYTSLFFFFFFFDGGENM